MGVWGDDFTFFGREKDLTDTLEKMKMWYSIKLRGIVGPDPGDMKEIRILNRLVRWTKDGIEYEADDKHVTTVVKGLGLQEDSKGVDVALPAEYGVDEGGPGFGPARGQEVQEPCSDGQFPSA